MQRKHRVHTFAVMAYAESPYLEECVLSLVNQTVKSRIVFYTATPSPSIISLSKKYEIPIVFNKAHVSLLDDWNFAYNNCESEYVTLVHQDDIYLPHYNEVCFSALDKVKNDDSLILFTWYNDLISGKEKDYNIKILIKKLLLLPGIIKPDIRSRLLRKAMLSFGTPIPCPSVMYHKSRIGAFHFSKAFNCNMDWDAWLRLSHMHGSFVFVNKKLLLHRLHEESLTSQQINSEGRKNEDLRIFRRLWPEPMARLLSLLYSISYKMNHVQ